MSTETAIQKNDSMVSYIPFGAQDAVKLTLSIVKNIVAVPTRSGKTCTDRDAIKFMALCQAQRLNPFAGDAFLIGFDTKEGPQFSLITAHQAFLKRAEASHDYNGMQSGVIVRDNGDDKISDIEGDFYDQKAFELVGGWAIVHHKKRQFPSKQRVKLERFRKPYGVWQDDPAGMICKVAESQALRAAFPTLISGLYLREEIEARAEIISPTLDASKLVEVAARPEQPDRNPEPPPPEAKEPPPADEAQNELAAFVTENGFTFDHLQKWGVETGNIPDADSLPSFGDIPSKICKRLLLAKAGLVKGLQAVKEGK